MRAAMSERSMARVIFRPPPQPMLPPMNFGSMAQICTGARRVAGGGDQASESEVAAWVADQPVAVGLGIDEASGSEERGRSRTLVLAVVKQAQARERVDAAVPAALGQTFQLDSRSFFQMIWRQPSHFCQRPSVRTCARLGHLGHLFVGIFIAS
jgi:hypothetical protein